MEVIVSLAMPFFLLGVLFWMVQPVLGSGPWRWYIGLPARVFRTLSRWSYTASLRLCRLRVPWYVQPITLPLAAIFTVAGFLLSIPADMLP